MHKTNQFRARVEVEAKKREWSLAEVARRIDKSAQTFQDILNRGNPRVSTINQLAKLFGMTIEEFMADVTVDEYGSTFLPRFKD